MGGGSVATPERLSRRRCPDLPHRENRKARKYHIPDQPPVSAEALLARGKWQKVSWRRGTKGRLACLFAARRVRVADGHKHRMLDNRMQCMPGDAVWLVGERRSTGEQKYCVSNLPADTTIKTLAATIKARGICEQTTSNSRRSWARPLRRDILEGIPSTCIDDDDRLCLSPIPPPQSSGTEKRVSGPPPQPSMPAIRQAILDLVAQPPPRRCPLCDGLLADIAERKMPK
jgi:hypothetical protein